MKVNNIKKEKSIQTEINFIQGNNVGHTPSSLGSRLIVVVKQ